MENVTDVTNTPIQIWVGFNVWLNICHVCWNFNLSVYTLPLFGIYISRVNIFPSIFFLLFCRNYALSEFTRFWGKLCLAFDHINFLKFPCHRFSDSSVSDRPV